MRQLHELLWYLTEALTLPAATHLHAAPREALDSTERLTHLPAEELAELDVSAHRDRTAALLLRAGELERATAQRRKKRTRRGTDLTGALFLTQAQLNAAKGNAVTKLRDTLSWPAHRSASGPGTV